MSEPIKVTIPNKVEYIGLARLTAAYTAAQIGFDLDTVDDIKLAVGEACNNAILHSASDNNLEILYQLKENGIEITVCDKGIGFSTFEYEAPDLNNLNEGGLGIFIIRSLMDKVEIVSKEGIGTTMTMTKYND